ncbi:MAG: hypothetical protein LIP01_11760 [Tannerellaceae bacterium]|nr:hypothetical protein [Tannerellaceae bacterium]
MSFNDVLYNLSYQNLIMYSSVLPSYDDEKDEEPEFDELLDANNPDNFSDDDEVVVRRR